MACPTGARWNNIKHYGQYYQIQGREDVDSVRRNPVNRAWNAWRTITLTFPFEINWTIIARLFDPFVIRLLDGEIFYGKKWSFYGNSWILNNFFYSGLIVEKFEMERCNIKRHGRIFSEIIHQKLKKKKKLKYVSNYVYNYILMFHYEFNILWLKKHFSVVILNNELHANPALNMKFLN